MDHCAHSFLDWTRLGG